MEIIKSEINKAIDIHSNWKHELSRTIESGNLETPVDVIEKDNECEFGKWLISPGLLKLVSTDATYHKIVTLHSEFHFEAGKIASLASIGKKQQAQKLMEVGGIYDTLSSNLIKSLKDWKI